MAVEFQDILKVNLVLAGLGLLNTPEEVEKFRRGAETEVLMPPVPGFGIGTGMPTPESHQVLTLNRERISCWRHLNSRLSSSVNYPVVQDFERFAQVAALAIKTTDLDNRALTAYGYNMDLVFDQNSTSPTAAYLAGRLFSAGLSEKLGWSLEGGAAKLTFIERMGHQGYGKSLLEHYH